MSNVTEYQRLRNLPLEDRAAQTPKSASCGVLSIAFLAGFLPGLYYWFIDEIVFSYRSVSPFWGFAILTCIGIAIACLISYAFNSYWKEFNEEIKNANKEILELIKSGNCNEDDLFRLKKDYIERKIGKEILTQEEFEWHSDHFCWGCGKEHTLEPKPYVVRKERTESWKEGAYRYTKTFHESAMILICPDCYARLSKTDRINAKNGDITSKINYALIAIVVIAVFVMVFAEEANSPNGSVGAGLGYGLFGAFLAFGLSLSLGQIILLPLSGLLALPFMNLKDGDSKTKWNFDEIPKIKRFMTKNLPHTH